MAWTVNGQWVDHPADTAPGGWLMNPATVRNPLTALGPGIGTRQIAQGGPAPPRAASHVHQPFPPRAKAAKVQGPGSPVVPYRKPARDR